MQSLHVQYTNDGIRRFHGVGWQVDGLDLNRDSQWSQMPALTWSVRCVDCLPKQLAIDACAIIFLRYMVYVLGTVKETRRCNP
jgi:hypothetical protein